MEHEQALEIQAAERYVLNEMDPPERFAFEAHYFTCEECAEDVRKGEMLAAGVRSIGRELPANVARQKPIARSRTWDWLLRPSTLIPSTAFAAVAVLAGYQALVLIPSLRIASQPQVVETAVLRAAARGEETVVKVSKNANATLLLLDVNIGQPGQRIEWSLEAPGNQPAGSGSATVPPAGTQLPLLTPNSELRSPGMWTLTLRTADGAESGRYPFRIE